MIAGKAAIIFGTATKQEARSDPIKKARGKI
jgi:hypothetical protein